jgi:uncharacterized membrane protein
MVVTAEGNVVVVVVGAVVVVVAATVNLAASVPPATAPSIGNENNTPQHSATTTLARIPATLATSMLATSADSGDTGPMGFNPTRKRVARPSDIWFVVSAVVVALSLVAWALLG